MVLRHQVTAKVKEVCILTKISISRTANGFSRCLTANSTGFPKAHQTLNNFANVAEWLIIRT